MNILEVSYFFLNTIEEIDEFSGRTSKNSFFIFSLS